MYQPRRDSDLPGGGPEKGADNDGLRPSDMRHYPPNKRELKPVFWQIRDQRKILISLDLSNVFQLAYFRTSKLHFSSRFGSPGFVGARPEPGSYSS